MQEGQQREQHRIDANAAETTRTGFKSHIYLCFHIFSPPQPHHLEYLITEPAMQRTMGSPLPLPLPAHPTDPESRGGRE